jgi:hypothetical protein
MLVGAPMAALAVVGWVVFAPPPFDARMLFMLIASTITGMLVVWGLGLWATILAPHRAKYSQMMGNDMSFVGIIVLLGAMLACLFAPRMLAQYGPALVSPDRWWIAPVPVIFALIFYAVSLRAAGTLLRRGRERLMAVVEGKG